MRAELHAIGRAADVLPYLALGARLHEVSSLEEAREVLRALAHERQALIMLSEELAAAEIEAPEALLIVLPGEKGASGMSLELTRELITRSVGVDLIARSKRMGS
jgi:vacuolar-type H+-ATPase subunit F/Vma7